MLQPQQKGFTVDCQRLAIHHVFLPCSADVHVVLLPSFRPVVAPLDVVIIRVVCFQPSESVAQFVDIHCKRSFQAGTASEAARLHFDKGHVSRQRRQGGKELRHFLTEVAHVPNVCKLPRPRDGIDLAQRMHQRQHHLLAIGERRDGWCEFLDR